jgi:hypothetical protein
MTRCTLCRRNLLAGETFRRWARPADAGPGRPVCMLCEPAAALDGWAQRRGTTASENADGLRGTVRRVVKAA